LLTLTYRGGNNTLTYFFWYNIYWDL